MPYKELIFEIRSLQLYGEQHLDRCRTYFGGNAFYGGYVDLPQILKYNPVNLESKLNYEDFCEQRTNYRETIAGKDPII